MLLLRQLQTPLDQVEIALWSSFAGLRFLLENMQSIDPRQVWPDAGRMFAIHFPAA